MKQSQVKHTANIYRRCKKNWRYSVQYLLIVKVRFCYTTMPGLTLQEWQLWSWMNLAMKFYSIHRIHQTYRQQTFTFFKHLNHFISRKTFSNTMNITNSINEFLDSKNPDFFKNGIHSLVDRGRSILMLLETILINIFYVLIFFI